MQGHEPVCTFVHTSVSSELTQAHPAWLGSGQLCSFPQE